MSLPIPPLAEAFASQCAAWAVARGATPQPAEAAAIAAKLVSATAAAGHVCVYLDELPPECDEATLLASGIVSRAGGAVTTPLVLDEGRRLYLARHYDQESRLAKGLLGLARHPVALPGPAALAALTGLFPAQGPKGQQLAAAQALSSHLTIISGGPGTGKTTTVANLLACLLADQPGLRIALAAPTGKAAARLMESLSQRAAHLPPEVSARLPQEAATVHRLLGIHPHQPRPRYHRGNPLPVDVLVVDEASMLDLSLATRLVEAVPHGARLVLLGDKDQLAAVEAGAVFSELSARAELSPERASLLASWVGADRASLPVAPQPGPLQNCVAWLKESYRFGADSPLGQLAAAMVAGEAEESLTLLARNAEVTTLVEENGEALSGASQSALVRAWDGYVAAVVNGQGDPAPVFAALDRYRVLCARRSGLRGVDFINGLLEKALRPLMNPGSEFLRGPHFVGRPIMVSQNDPVTRLFNGDIGVLLKDGDSLCACFPGGQGDYRRLPLARLPAHDTAFALTIHKSQGSEFDRVSVILPADDSPLMTRELIYTAITRARQGVEILASQPVLETCIQRRTRRHNGLGSRLLSG